MGRHRNPHSFAWKARCLRTIPNYSNLNATHSAQRGNHMSASTGGKRRLDLFRQLLAHVSEQIMPGVGFQLWDGSTVPARLPSDAPVIVFADEAVFAAMIRRPNIHTLLNLYVTARLDIRNGTLFDLFALRPKLRTRELVKRLDKRLLFATAARFFAVPRGGPWPLESIRGDKARADGSEAANKENVHYHYDLSNAFYALFLDPEMVYTCAYFTDWNNDIATAQRHKL